jgi:phosphohistidine phosphatase
VELILVRHAIAEDRDTARWPDDADRPLTAEGEAAFRRGAKGLVHLIPEVDEVRSSPFARAWRTAELLAEAGWPAPVAHEPLGAGRSPLDLAEELARSPGPARLALVGHEPTLSELASILLAGSATRVLIEMKKGAAFVLDTSDPPEAGHASLRMALSPKALRALGR